MSVPAETITINTARNLEAMEAFFALANSLDVEGILRMAHPDYVGESDILPEPVRGKQGYRDLLSGFWAAFPDTRYEVEQMLASENTVVTRLRVTGSHRGKFMGMEGTGKKFAVHICHVDQFTDGTIKRAWYYWDFGTLLRQLGIAAS